GIMPGVGGRGNGGRELLNADLAADLLELATLVELVGEGDRVDWLALDVQPEGRAIDLRVALAVVLAPVARQHLAHGGDRAGSEHHRPEDRLLGVEILRGNV